MKLLSLENLFIQLGSELIIKTKNEVIKFVNFKHTMEFVNKVAVLAENEGHHPDMFISYGSCIIEQMDHMPLMAYQKMILSLQQRSMNLFENLKD